MNTPSDTNNQPVIDRLRRANPISVDDLASRTDDSKRTKVLQAVLHETARGGRFRSASRRRTLVPALVVGFILLAAGALAGVRWAAPDDVPPGIEPQPQGPSSVIASGFDLGSDWALTAQDSDQGLCLYIETGRSRAGGCDFDVPEQSRITVATRTTDNGQFFYGPVAVNVSRVRLDFASGHSAEIGAVENQDFDVDFFVKALDGHDELDEAIAFDDRGNVVGRYDPSS